ncbi:hypothetical protein DFH27DRAFT_645136 [Peziza echinospora]|nr:hypothetical protein DFH27DRAFT_645136 [Peziza echinospora]
MSPGPSASVPVPNLSTAELEPESEPELEPEFEPDSPSRLFITIGNVRRGFSDKAKLKAFLQKSVPVEGPKSVVFSYDSNLPQLLMSTVISHYKEVLNSFSVLPPYAPPTPDTAACASEFMMHDCRCGKCSAFTANAHEATGGLERRRTMPKDEVVGVDVFGKGTEHPTKILTRDKVAGNAVFGNGEGRSMNGGKVEPVVHVAASVEGGGLNSPVKCGRQAYSLKTVFLEPVAEEGRTVGHRIGPESQAYRGQGRFVMGLGNKLYVNQTPLLREVLVIIFKDNSYECAFSFRDRRGYLEPLDNARKTGGLSRHIRETCSAWETLLVGCREFIAEANINALEGDPRSIELDKGFLRRLIKASRAWESLKAIHINQTKAVKNLKDVWPEGLLGADHELKEIDQKGITIDVVAETRELIQRSNIIISIDEAYRSREQNESMKRLSWITFIFLPLLFVSAGVNSTIGLYGMNIDLLRDNPPWTTYFYIATPVFILLLLVVLGLKFRLIQDARDSIVDMCSMRQRNTSTVIDVEQAVGFSELDAAMRGPFAEDQIAFAAAQGNVGALDGLLNVYRAKHAGDRYQWMLNQALNFAAAFGMVPSISLLLMLGANCNVPTRCFSIALPAQVPGTVFRTPEGIGNAHEGHAAHLALLDNMIATISNTRRDGILDAMTGAVCRGQPVVVQHMLDVEPYQDVILDAKWELARWMVNAAESGNMEVFRAVWYAADLYPPYDHYQLKQCLRAAASGGHLAIVDFILELFKEDFQPRNSTAEPSAEAQEVGEAVEGIEMAPMSPAGPALQLVLPLDIVAALARCGRPDRLGPAVAGMLQLECTFHGIRECVTCGWEFVISIAGAGATVVLVAAVEAHGEFLKRLQTSLSEYTGYDQPICTAARGGHVDMVTFLLQNLHLAQQLYEDPVEAIRRAIEQAAQNGHDAVLARIDSILPTLSEDAELVRRGYDLALLGGATKGKPSVCTQLLKFGTAVWPETKKSIVELTIEYSQNIFKRGIWFGRQWFPDLPRGPVHSAIAHVKEQTAILLLTETVKTKSLTRSRLQGSMSLAVEEGCPNVVRFLLEQTDEGAQLNCNTYWRRRNFTKNIESRLFSNAC